MWHYVVSCDIMLCNVCQVIFFGCSETMSVQAFHNIHMNLHTFHEMILTNKKEAVIWSRRWDGASGKETIKQTTAEFLGSHQNKSSPLTYNDLLL